MKIRLSNKIYFTALVLLCLASCSQNEDPIVYDKSAVKLQKYQWQGALPKKSLIRVINRYGNITTRNTNQTSIELSGIIQKIGSEAPTPEIVISDNDGVTLVEVIYQDPTVDNFGNRVGRMDIGVYAPKGITVEMETDFGDIKAKKHQSNLIAKSQSGKIKLATTGTINAVSQSGAITANLLPWDAEKFKPVNKKRRYEVHSLEGDVQIYFSPQSGLDINLQAGKEITSNSDDLQNLLANKLTSLQFVVGNQERYLTVSSNQGNIQIDSVKQSNLSSSPVAAQSLDTDIRNLPKADSWQPGDPIIEMQDGRSDKDTKDQKPVKKDFKRPLKSNQKEENRTQKSS